MPVYINTITDDCCMLPLCLETLVNSQSLSVMFWFFYIHSHVICQKWEIYCFISSFQILRPLFYICYFFFFPFFALIEIPVPCWLQVVITSLLSPLSHGESFQYFIIKYVFCKARKILCKVVNVSFFLSDLKFLYLLFYNQEAFAISIPT